MCKTEVSNTFRVAKERTQAELKTATAKTDPLQMDVFGRSWRNEETKELQEERGTAQVDVHGDATRAGCCLPLYISQWMQSLQQPN